MKPAGVGKVMRGTGCLLAVRVSISPSHTFSHTFSFFSSSSLLVSSPSLLHPSPPPPPLPKLIVFRRLRSWHKENGMPATRARHIDWPKQHERRKNKNNNSSNNKNPNPKNPTAKRERTSKYQTEADQPAILHWYLFIKVLMERHPPRTYQFFLFN